MSESFTLKPISRAAIPRALEKAERYRLLDDPEQAQSICLDILAADPDNQPVLVVLILSMTDQFGRPGTRSVPTVDVEVAQVDETPACKQRRSARRSSE